MIPPLLACRDLVPVLGVSAEPLLGPINLIPPETCWLLDSYSRPRIDCVIVGGESGHGARPCQVDWIRSIRDQCGLAGVPCFIKQLGSKAWGQHNSNPAGSCLDGSCFELQLVDNKGGDWSEWPEDLRVRQYPELGSTMFTV